MKTEEKSKKTVRNDKVGRYHFSRFYIPKYAREVADGKFSCILIKIKVQMHTSPQSGMHFRPSQTDGKFHDFRNICACC